MEILSSVVSKKLDLVNKLYQRSILPHVETVASGERLHAPLVIDLDPTTFCDLSCPECISKNLLNNGQVGQDRIERLAHELVEAQVKAVILIGGGEPLMHKSIGIVIGTLAEAGIHLGLVTNGTLIHRYLDRLANNISWVRVSIDAATPETHGLFRPSGRKSSVFPTIVSNMRELAKRKKGKLGYSFLLMYRQDATGAVTDTNYHELLEAGTLARDIGCDYFEVKAAFDEGHFILHTPENLLAAAKQQRAALADLETDNFRILESSTFTSLVERRNRVQSKNYNKCLTTELRTTVTPSGVYVCPYHRGNPFAKIGDIGEMSFQSMWQNADTAIVNPQRDCNFHCARHNTNLEIAGFHISPPNRSQLVEDFDLFI